MLSYLILTTRGLMMAAVIFGIICGYAGNTGRRFEKNLIWGFAVIGTVISIVISYLRNTTSLIDSAILNGTIYAISLIAFLLFLVLRIRPLAVKVPGVISFVLAGILLVTVIAYAMPEVWAYPYHVLQSEETAISTDFLMSMIGLAFGLILMVVVFFSVKNCTELLSEKGILILLCLELLLNACLRLSGLISVFFQKRVIRSNHTLFVYTVFVKNHADWFIYLSLLLVVGVSVILWIRSVRQNEPYRNPAEQRKIRAKWRRIRRWSTAVAVTAVLGVCNLTVAEALNRTDVTLSPVEEVSGEDKENIYVAFDKVDDGHLHRFAYETEKGISIRFIVIKKPNSSSYGVGLDACDVCGETGYYEKDGQVVCNLCDVVMNISTIGFKGGCNPIVIPYEIKNGQIIVPISGLLEYESEFKG